MFNLDQAISEWRQQMAAGGISTPDVLNELESHLREDVDEQVRAGLSAEKAFELATQRLGHPKTLRREFEKIGEAPDATASTRRITVIERDVMLPIKAVGILMLLYSFYASNWFVALSSIYIEQVTVQFMRQVMWVYIALNLLMAGLLMAARRCPLAWLHMAVFTMSLADGLFLSLVCLFTGGYTSVVYWVFLGLIVRNSASIPRTASQVLLNLSVLGCYALTAIFDVWFHWYLSPTGQGLLEPYVDPNATEQVLTRVMLLLLVAACCFLVQLILSRQRLRPTTQPA